MAPRQTYTIVMRVAIKQDHRTQSLTAARTHTYRITPTRDCDDQLQLQTVGPWAPHDVYFLYNGHNLLEVYWGEWALEWVFCDTFAITSSGRADRRTPFWWWGGLGGGKELDSIRAVIYRAIDVMECADLFKWLHFGRNDRRKAAPGYSVRFDGESSKDLIIKDCWAFFEIII